MSGLYVQQADLKKENLRFSLGYFLFCILLFMANFSYTILEKKYTHKKESREAGLHPLPVIPL